MTIIESYQEKFTQMGLSLSIEKNTSSTSVYRDLYVLTNKSGDRFGIKVFRESTCIHILFWEGSAPIVRNKFKYYSELIEMCKTMANEESILLYAQCMPWEGAWKESGLFTSFFLIQPEHTFVLRISRHCSGWLYGELEENLKRELERVSDIQHCFTERQSEDPLNEYAILNQRLQAKTYIDGEVGTFDFSSWGTLTYTPNAGIETKVILESHQSYREVLDQMITKIKGKRRLLNLYNPPRRQYDRLCGKLYRYDQGFRDRVYTHFCHIYSSWEERELFFKRISDQLDFSATFNNYSGCLRVGNLAFVHSSDTESNVFHVFDSSDEDAIIECMENVTFQSIRQIIRSDIKRHIIKEKTCV